jgi:hypothetical protein
MESYLEYMRIFEPDTLKNMYKKEKELEQIDKNINLRI